MIALCSLSNIHYHEYWAMGGGGHTDCVQEGADVCAHTLHIGEEEAIDETGS